MSYYHRPSARILLYLCLLPASVPSPPVVLNSHKDIEIQPQEMGAIKHQKKTCLSRAELNVSLDADKVNGTAGSIRYPHGQSEEKIRKPSCVPDDHRYLKYHKCDVMKD